VAPAHLRAVDATDGADADASGPADDESLVRRARVDPDAFALLFRRHAHAVHGFAYRRSGSREVAEEVTAATFERAWRALPTFTWRGGGLEPWLFRIAAGELAGWYRRERRHHTPRAQLVLREMAENHTTDDGGPEGDEAVRAALGRLRPRYQQALTLKYFSGLSAEEAAAAMSCSKPTFAVTVHRALRALRSALSEGDTP
jgi:RNA polymerase sigma factor (sigma-70 family)